jgi:hypothetical protein
MAKWFWTVINLEKKPIIQDSLNVRMTKLSLGRKNINKMTRYSSALATFHGRLKIKKITATILLSFKSFMMIKKYLKYVQNSLLSNNTI